MSKWTAEMSTLLCTVNW